MSHEDPNSMTGDGKSTDELVRELHEVVTGNGDPKRGLISRVQRVEIYMTIVAILVLGGVGLGPPVVQKLMGDGASQRREVIVVPAAKSGADIDLDRIRSLVERQLKNEEAASP